LVTRLLALKRGGRQARKRRKVVRRRIVSGSEEKEGTRSQLSETTKEEVIVKEMLMGQDEVGGEGNLEGVRDAPEKRWGGWNMDEQESVGSPWGQEMIR